MICFSQILTGQIGHVYVLQLKAQPNLYKIGRSALGNLGARFRRLRVGQLVEVVFAGVFLNYKQWEKLAHQSYRNSRVPQTEYFWLGEMDLHSLLRKLRQGNLEMHISGSSGETCIRADDGFLIISDGIYDDFVLEYSSVDSFCLALESLKNRISLSPEALFSDCRGYEVERVNEQIAKIP